MPKLRTIVANLTASMKPDRLGSNAMPLARWKKAPASGGEAGAFVGFYVPWGRPQYEVIQAQERIQG